MFFGTFPVANYLDHAGRGKHATQYSHTACYQFVREQEFLGNFQAAQSLLASFPWAVMNSSLP